MGSSKVQVTRDVRTLLDELTKSNHEAAERWQAVAVERLQAVGECMVGCGDGRESGSGAIWEACC